MHGEIVTGLLSVFALGPMLGICIGVVVGLIFGAIPGLASIMAVAIILPMTFYLDPIIGIPMLLAVYKAGIFGGSISAILINTPGTVASFLTGQDGYALAKKGKAGKALGMALAASVTGDTLSDIVLVLVAAPISVLALKAGPIERLFLILFALTVVGSISGKSINRGLLSCCLGMLFAMVGISAITGTARFTFGITELTGGFTFVPMIIGVLVMPEVLENLKGEKRSQNVIQYKKSTNPLDNKLTWKEYCSVLKTMLKSTAIGTVIGALPGLGSSTAAFISYGEAKRVSKTPEKFGEGALEGIAACESGNNAVCGSTMIPMLTLGIPGDDVTAVLMGAFLIQGLTPGPSIFFEHTKVIYGIYGGLLMCNVVVYIIAKSGFNIWIRLANIPKHYIFACVAAFSITGAFAIDQSLFDILILLIFMVLGYLFKLVNFNPAAFVVGFILFPFLEENLSQAMVLTDGNPFLFFTKPFAWVFIVLSLISLWSTKRQKDKAAKNIFSDHDRVSTTVEP